MSYDGNLNLTGDNTHSYSYNAQNQLVLAGGVTVQLVYDGLGRVLKRTINNNATIFVYDGWKVIEELDGSGNRVAWNIYGAGADEILYRNQNGTALLYHTDKEGNVMFLLDGAGNGIERYTYDAFGAPRITDWDGNLRAVSAYGNRYMFNGKDYVAEMGLYDYRHRWYQPQLGRFLQVDPKGFDAGDENLFRYCMDDPVDRTDPDGLIGIGYQAEQAAEKERVYEVTKEVREEVTGSHIPQVVGTETTLIGSPAAVRAVASAIVSGSQVSAQQSGTQQSQNSSGAPYAFEILGNSPAKGTYITKTYQALTENGRPTYTNSYQVAEETTVLKPHTATWGVAKSDGRFTTLKNGKWSDGIGFDPRNGPPPRGAGIDIREQRFRVRPVGDTGKGTLMHSVFLHITQSHRGVISNGVYDVSPDR